MAYFELKIKDEFDLKELKNYGFRIEPERAYYFLKENDIEIFIWKSKDKAYKQRHIYIEPDEHIMIIETPSIIFDLIQAGIVEKVEVKR